MNEKHIGHVTQVIGPVVDVRFPDGELPALLDFFGTEEATALDYWFDNSLLSGYKKPPKRLEPHADVVRADMNFYRRLGFERVSSFACYLGADYRALYGLPDLTSFREEN